MGNVKFELNTKGVGQLLKSDTMRAVLEDASSDIARRCGEGYLYDSKMMGTRVISSVYTDSFEAMKDNLDNNTILRNLRG